MRTAYIDIGYNAIRAVVYENSKLGSISIFNDKFKSDILSLLEANNFEIKHQVYLSIQYISHIFSQLMVNKIYCVATAALRGHPKALEFKNIIYTRYNIDIEILSGEREAYLTALGLISGIHQAKGIVADLGGGSLELAAISNREVGKIKSLELGTKVITRNNIADSITITQMIQNEFGQANYSNLYLIGGALRFIGKFYMDFIHYPIKNLHNFEVPTISFLIYLEKLGNISQIQPVYDKRIDSNAVIVLKAMISVFKPEKIIISNYGLKEGLRFDSLSIEEQNKNIVYEKIKEFVNVDIEDFQVDSYRKEVSKLIVNPNDLTKYILEYAILLTQFNRSLDRNLKARFVVDFILSCDIPFSHYERLMLSMCLGVVYNIKIDNYINKLAKKMLNKSDYYNSQIMGCYIKITRLIDGPEFKIPSFSFRLKEKYIEIVTPGMLPHQVFGKVCEWLKDIAFFRKMANNNFPPSKKIN